jgi:cellulose synthase/poly-beta-1,6-N-acetylglucosamine synthase-like glycosyltransferase
MTFLLISLACIAAFLFVYPYAIYPLILRFLPEYHGARKTSLGRREAPEAALLFCAHNEETALPAKITNLRMLKQELPTLKILAYSDCSTDATNQLLLNAADVLEPVIGKRRVGKVMGMQELVKRAHADILVFTDANVIIESRSLTRMLEYFSDPEIGCVAATLVYVDNAGDSQSTTARVGGFYWRLEEYIKRLESRSGSTMGADGSFFARRRHGYPRLPTDLVDDMAVSLGVLFDGQRCVSAPNVRGFETSVADRSEEFRRKRRIACGSYSTYRFLRDRICHLRRIDRFKFVSHKLIRWWGAVFLMLALAFTLVAFVTSGNGLIGTAIVAGSGLLLLMLGRFGSPLFGPPYEILLAVIATGIGVIESIAGRRYATWNPAKTR